MMKQTKIALSLLAAPVLAACSSEGYTPYLAQPYAYSRAGETEYDRFTLQRTACFGFCPIYKVIVNERDVLFFEGEQFVVEDDGVVSKRLPKGSFDELLKLAKAHQFSGFDRNYPNENGDNCETVAADLPGLVVKFESERLTHEVNLYEGCFGFEGRERFQEMVAAMEAVLDIDDWVGPREQFTGEEE